MVELEEAAFAAASSVVGDEGTAALIALRDRALNFRRDVPRVVGLATAPAATLRRRELLALEIGDQERERAIEHLGQVSADASTRSRSASARVLVEAATESARFPRRGRRGATPLANRRSA
jgi:hypothetical protein